MDDATTIIAEITNHIKEKDKKFSELKFAVIGDTGKFTNEFLADMYNMFWIYRTPNDNKELMEVRNHFVDKKKLTEVNIPSNQGLVVVVWGGMNVGYLGDVIKLDEAQARGLCAYAAEMRRNHPIMIDTDIFEQWKKDRV